MACLRVNPDVAVLALLNFSHSGWVTYFATREFLDLISGKGSDMLEDAVDPVMKKWVETDFFSRRRNDLHK